MDISLRPIAFVNNERNEILDDQWGTVMSEIILAKGIHNESLNGIEEFSHLEIIFYMNQVDDKKAIIQNRHPRNNRKLPMVGTFAQRNKNRPNKLGLTTVKLISKKGNTLTVENLDAINGTPILDIKPVMKNFEPIGEIIEPTWVSELLNNYW